MRKQMSLFNTMAIHEAQQVISKLAYRKGLVASGRFPMATGINRIHMIPLGKYIDLSLEVFAVLSISMEKNKRIPVTFFYVIVLNIHSFSFFADFFTSS